MENKNNNNNDNDDSFDDDLFDEPHKKYNIITLAAIILAIVGLVGATWYIYDSYKEKNDDEMLLITADQDEIKVEPVDPGGMVVDNMDKSVYEQIENNKHEETKAETLLLPSEEPIDKSSLVNSEEKEAAATEVSEVAEVIIPAEVEVVEPVSPPSVPTKKTVAPVVKPEPSMHIEEEFIQTIENNNKPRKKVSKKETKPAIKPAANGKFYKVQISACKSKSEAEQEWRSMNKKTPDLFVGLDHYVVTKEIEGRGTFYRLQVGPFNNGSDAHSACKQFKDSGLNCFIIKP